VFAVGSGSVAAAPAVWHHSPQTMSQVRPAHNPRLQRTSARGFAAVLAAEAHSLAIPMRVVLIISALAVVTACRSTSATAFGQQESPIDRVSLAAVIADPKAFEGHHLRVHGFLHLEFEDNSLYLSEAERDARDEKRALWIVLNPAYLQTSRDTLWCLSDHPVVVEGIVKADHHGHMGMWPAELTRVTYIAQEGGR
jgi:hypothetical protein